MRIRDECRCFTIVVTCQIMSMQITFRSTVEHEANNIRLCFGQSFDGIIHDLAVLVSCGEQQCLVGTGADD